MQKTNKSCAEIIHEEMNDFAKLVMKYSPRQLILMVNAVDINGLQHEMEMNGATREELQMASECHNDIHEIINLTAEIFCT